ncbi:hypothetical protein D477_003593 [Arthrobacter crystallopoietes BAB-32]|uniref:Transmembrane protein n=1 Tax=Arthrobacter crystallopoietes BAB-32 TaxID=1246476 RepID=N1V652_9MICC|nr:DUF3054 domain-containing protein [Arthrobacter crystallopoietes]EMY35587.1 hypothetical protein D477_003593 [Arthrobacter crystallopoietes BAB-32]
MNHSPARSSTPSIVLALAADAAAVVLFAGIGRDTHEHGLDPAGILLTASPFLAGTLIGWAVSRAWRKPLALWPTGIIIWACAVVLGLVLRGVSGGGLAFSFQIVTTLVLAAFLLGWRLAAHLVIRIRNRRRVAYPRN